MGDRVLVVYNDYNSDASRHSRIAADFLKAEGLSCDIVPYSGYQCCLNRSDYKLAISFGGDGTFLHTARLIAAKGIPVLPVNLGSFGFITEIEIDEWQKIFHLFCDGQIPFSERIILDVKHWRGDELVNQFHGINDAVISHQESSRIVELSLSLPEADLGHFTGDGVIISTPTGSTAYSLAAGGPILYPEMDALLFTPICPFSLSFRPLLIPGNETFRIYIDKEQRTGLSLTVDGQAVVSLSPEDSLTIEAADEKLRVILSDRRNFYQVVRSKLGWSGGVNA